MNLGRCFLSLSFLLFPLPLSVWQRRLP
jgi:hypothetical protein